MKAIQLESQVGDDGVLSLLVPLGPTEARSRVIVTIAPSPSRLPTALSDSSGWHEFIARTYGSCADLGLEEPADLPLPEDDPPA